MSFSYGILTGDVSHATRDYVRLMITDTDSADYVFEDQELDVFLLQAGDDALLAAADALDTMARNEALVSKRIRILDLTTDGPAVAKSLMDSAKVLRERVTAGADEEPAFAIAEFIGNPFGLSEHVWRGLGVEP